eukprot:XP_019921641.1 PREDICTED: uncharacterized protein LOC109618408 [Crassostrea gigas]
MEQHAHDHSNTQIPPPPAYGTPHPQQLQTSSSQVTIVTTGGFQQPEVVTAPVRNYDQTFSAIVGTICFLPSGICALILALNAKNQFRAGDTDRAQTSNNWASRLTQLSFICGGVWIGLVIFFSIRSKYIHE